jgi:hypothetical protein
MKKLLSLGVVSRFIGLTFIGMTFISVTAMTLAGSQDRDVNDGVRDRFVGAWRLAWLECTGLLVYTADGHMSVQVMYRNPQANPQANPQTAPNAAPV